MAEFSRHHHQETFDSFLGVSSVERKSFLLAQHGLTNLNIWSFNQSDGKPKLFVIHVTHVLQCQLRRDEVMMSPPPGPITEGNEQFSETIKP